MSQQAAIMAIGRSMISLTEEIAADGTASLSDFLTGEPQETETASSSLMEMVSSKSALVEFVSTNPPSLLEIVSTNPSSLVVIVSTNPSALVEIVSTNPSALVEIVQIIHHLWWN